MKSIRFIVFAVILSAALFGLIFQYRVIKNQDRILSQKESEILSLNLKLEENKKAIKKLKEDESFLHPVEIKLKKCMERAYSTPEISNCSLEAKEEWSAEIEKSIKELKNFTSPKTYALILNSQSAWEKYRDVQRKVIYDTIWNLDGSIYINISHFEDTDITEQRAKELIYILKILKNE